MRHADHATPRSPFPCDLMRHADHATPRSPFPCDLMRLVFGEEGVVAEVVKPASAHEPDRGDHRAVRCSRREQAGDRGPDRLRALDAEERQVVAHALRRRLAVGAHADQDIGLVLETAGVVLLRPFDLGQQRRDVVEPRVGIGPAHEAVERPRLAIVVAGMERLEVLLAFSLGPGEGDLDDLAHLRRPAPERLDELAEGERAGRLRAKLVFVDVLHGVRILAAVRRTPTRRTLACGDPSASARLFVAALILVGSLVSSGPIEAAGPPLRFLAGAPGTLDPAYINDAGDVQLLLQLYGGLTRLDETGEPYPSLASGWEVSADGLTYTFTLRDDLEFSDGSSLDATDVRRSWLRLLDSETGSSAPDVLNVVEGATDRLAGSAGEDEVGIEAPDATTLIVHLRHPAAYFPEITATPATFVVPDAAGIGDDWQTPDAFVGSGPYIVDGTDGADLVLRANERYVAGAPPIDEVRWVSDIDGDAVTAFADGALDLVQVGGFDATWIAYDAALGPRLHLAEALSVSYFGFITTRPPFDDERVRRAFALALDRERLVGLSEGADAVAAASIVPPAIWPSGLDGSIESNPDEARALLAEAGYEDPADLGRIVVNGSGLGVEPAVAAWREELGVEIDVETMDFDAYIDLLDTDPPQVFTVNWIADYPSPHAIYSLLLEPGAVSNYGDWTDDEFAELLDAAAAAEGEAEIAAAYQAADAYVREQAPLIPWSYGSTWWLVADGLRGLGNLTTGLIDLGRVSWGG
jgi:ABC-type transport system substrate-binding protein